MAKNTKANLPPEPITLERFLDGLGDAENELLDERTRLLGGETGAVLAESDHVEYLVFQRGDVRLMIETQHVVRMFEGIRVSIIPCAPPLLTRVCHVDGRIVSVIDPLALVAPDQAAPPERALVLLVEDGTTRLGLFADAVHGIESVDPSRVIAADTEGATADCIKGTGPNLSVVLDAHVLVQSTRESSARDDSKPLDAIAARAQETL